MTSHSRRTLLAGAASTLPVLALPSSAGAATEADDPIFAAIERCRLIEEAVASAESDERYDLVGRDIRASREALARTVPTTLAGLLALTTFVAKMSEAYEVPYFEVEESPEAMDYIRSLAAAASALAKGVVS